MKVLHVNNVDLVGRRFNGYDLISELAPRGVQGSQAVLTKLSDNPAVFSLFEQTGDFEFNEALQRVERRHAMNGLLFPWGRVLSQSQSFMEADVVHYHLIHNFMFSLLDMPTLTAQKPSIWTFHDCWPLTGHCIQPMDCPGWMAECTPCPHLDWYFPMQHDRAGDMWRVKQQVYSRSDVDVVVASEFMANMVNRSQLGAALSRAPHLIPFGVRTDYFLDDGERQTSRARLGIPESDFVIFFRAEAWELKGLDRLVEALRLRAPERATTLLAVGTKGLLRDLKAAYRIVDLGWVNDADLYPRLFSAADVFVMPSLAEAFGLMALEAMAAGRPVVSFNGTPLPDLTRAPECGIAVPLGDSTALRAAIDQLAANPADAQRRGAMGRAIALSDFSHSLYLDRLSELYGTVAERRTPTPNR